MKTNMKTNQLMALLAAGLLWAVTAPAQLTTNTFTFNQGITIPDGDSNGMALTYDLSVPSMINISNVTVSLDISNGYNGDLYAYLAGPNGGFSVLLNRTGVTNGNSFGYSDTGFNVTLSDAAASGIQYYQSAAGGYTLNGAGQLTGTWQPDGVNIDPQSSPSLLASTSPSALLSSFDGTDPNGTWTLFLADLSAGSQSVEGPISVTVVSVPEPATLALAATGGIALLLLNQSRKRRH
jgi:subtilisin-like proprotein convertase family protein